MTLLEKSYMNLKTAGRLSQKRLLTEQIMLQMKRVSAEYGVTFVTVLLQAGEQTKRHYIKFLGDNDIQAVDCAHDITEEMKVPGEGHPNGRMNTLWAGCISNALAARFGIDMRPAASCPPAPPSE